MRPALKLTVLLQLAVSAAWGAEGPDDDGQPDCRESHRNPLGVVRRSMALTTLDWMAIAVYFSVLPCVAWWVAKREGRSCRALSGRPQFELVDHRRDLAASAVVLSVIIGGYLYFLG